MANSPDSRIVPTRIPVRQVLVGPDGVASYGWGLLEPGVTARPVWNCLDGAETMFTVTGPESKDLIKVRIHGSPELGPIGEPDPAAPSDLPDEVTEDNGRENWIARQKDVALVRLKDCGLTCRDSDRDGDDMQSFIARKAKVLWSGNAELAGQCVTLPPDCRPVQEICYEIDATRWYCYVLQRGIIGSWWEECWTTSRRLTAQAAIETIARTRELARP